MTHPAQPVTPSPAGHGTPTPRASSWPTWAGKPPQPQGAPLVFLPAAASRPGSQSSGILPITGANLERLAAVAGLCLLAGTAALVALVATGAAGKRGRPRRSPR